MISKRDISLLVCHAATVLWLPLRAYTFLVRSSPSEAAESPLGEAALLLLLLLLHHAPSVESGQHNSFRRAFTGMQARPSAQDCSGYSWK